jgi:glucosamine-6-phosphate deaminase
VDLPPDRFHGFDLERDVEQACREMEALVGAGVDLTLLGIGTNGHVGMNEPGSTADSLTRRVTLAPETVASSARYFTHGCLPTWGVTMGLGTIGRSREVWLLASGTAKAWIVRATVEGPVTPEVPASLLRNHPRAVFVVDDDAASRLSR